MRRHQQHVYRVAAVFAFGFLTFLVVRHLLVPADFGVYGFYRAGALDDARARPISYAGQDRCASCHWPVFEARTQARHATIPCESCHGPLAGHAVDPSVKPATLDPRPLCLNCHTKMEGKWPGFPQVDPAEHNDGIPCSVCHQPHSPKIR
jgi:hypothetical protein